MMMRKPARCAGATAICGYLGCQGSRAIRRADRAPVSRRARARCRRSRARSSARPRPQRSAAAAPAEKPSRLFIGPVTSAQAASVPMPARDQRRDQPRAAGARPEHAGDKARRRAEHLQQHRVVDAAAMTGGDRAAEHQHAGGQRHRGDGADRVADPSRPPAATAASASRTGIAETFGNRSVTCGGDALRLGRRRHRRRRGGSAAPLPACPARRRWRN